MARTSVIAAAVWFGLAGAAQAGLEICNQTDEMQSVAIGYKGDTDWTSEGWWNIEPGQCSVLVGGDLTKRYYYYFADSKAGGFRGQDYVFCTRDDEFTIVGDADCEARGFARTSFREIDTGETSTAFTLTLVNTATSPGSGTTGAKGPGGGEEFSSEVATQTVTEAPATPTIDIDETALSSPLPPGRHGAPFEVAAFFQGCELEDGRAYCGFHAAGTKLRAFYKGPTDKEMLYALEEMPVNTPVMVAGDEVERNRLQAAVVLRTVRPLQNGDALAGLRGTLQGDWQSAGDAKSVISIFGSEIFVRYDGAFRTTRFMQLAARCEGLRGDGPVLIQASPGEDTPKCYRVETADNRRLILAPVAGGKRLRFEKLR